MRRGSNSRVFEPVGGVATKAPSVPVEPLSKDCARAALATTSRPSVLRAAHTSALRLKRTGCFRIFMGLLGSRQAIAGAAGLVEVLDFVRAERAAVEEDFVEQLLVGRVAAGA